MDVVLKDKQQNIDRKNNYGAYQPVFCAFAKI
jgi:hypothetical protein